MFSEKTAVIIQALKTIGPDLINDRHVEVIRNQLTDDERESIRQERRFTFAWMQPFLMRIAEGEQNA